MLSKDNFQHIKDGLESRNFHVKVIFLMRDPLERIWSIVRMRRRVAKNTNSTPEEQEILEKFKTPNFELRTRYDRTITELEKVFDTDNIYYNFYEKLFTYNSYSKLENFLKIKLATPDFSTKVNESPKEKKSAKKQERS